MNYDNQNSSYEDLNINPELIPDLERKEQPIENQVYNSVPVMDNMVKEEHINNEVSTPGYEPQVMSPNTEPINKVVEPVITEQKLEPVQTEPITPPVNNNDNIDNRKSVVMLSLAILVTLLIAIAGTAYAYFTFNASITSGTSVITSTTGSVGNVSLTATTPTMHITTTALDFELGNVGTYWATATSADHVSIEETKVINTITVSDNESANIYKCSYNLNVETIGLPDSGMAASGEYVVYISGVSTPITLDMGTNTNRNINFVVNRYITAVTPKTLSASAKLVNTSLEQNYLQDKTIETTFTASDISCGVVNSGGLDFVAKYGDVNGDGIVDASDATLLLDYTLMPDLYSISFDELTADVNSDGVITSDDAVLIQRYANGEIDILPFTE